MSFHAIWVIYTPRYDHYLNRWKRQKNPELSKLQGIGSLLVSCASFQHWLVSTVCVRCNGVCIYVQPIDVLLQASSKSSTCWLPLAFGTHSSPPATWSLVQFPVNPSNLLTSWSQKFLKLFSHYYAAVKSHYTKLTRKIPDSPQEYVPFHISLWNHLMILKYSQTRPKKQLEWKTKSDCLGKVAVHYKSDYRGTTWIGNARMVDKTYCLGQVWLCSTLLHSLSVRSISYVLCIEPLLEKRVHPDVMNNVICLFSIWKFIYCIYERSESWWGQAANQVGWILWSHYDYCLDSNLQSLLSRVHARLFVWNDTNPSTTTGSSSYLYL